MRHSIALSVIHAFRFVGEGGAWYRAAPSPHYRVQKSQRDNQPLKSLDLFTRRAYNYPLRACGMKSLYVREELARDDT